jgi:hypothetical protein
MDRIAVGDAPSKMVRHDQIAASDTMMAIR